MILYQIVKEYAIINPYILDLKDGALRVGLVKVNNFKDIKKLDECDSTGFFENGDVAVTATFDDFETTITVDCYGFNGELVSGELVSIEVIPEFDLMVTVTIDHLGEKYSEYLDDIHKLPYLGHNGRAVILNTIDKIVDLASDLDRFKANVIKLDNSDN